MYRFYTIPGTIKQGYLVKSPPLEKRGLKGWKKRWCMFSQADGEEPCLNYYHTEEEAFSSLPIKRVSLKSCCKVEIDLSHSNYKNIFAIYLPERVYYFSAASQTEMCEWADTLCSHLNLTSSSDVHQNKSSTLPADFSSMYGPSPTLRPLPKLPNSPLPRTPSSPLPRAPNSQLPRTPNCPLPKAPNSPLPPIPRESSHSALPLPHSPKHHRHLTTPPVMQHGNTMPPSLNRYSSSSPSPPVPARGSHTLPITTSPLLKLHQPHSPQGPSVPPRHSPTELYGRSQGRLSPSPIDRVDFRPPAPPPKTVEHDEYDLEDDPPTPPPRRATFSPNKIQLFSSSDSDDDCYPPLPPRSQNLDGLSHNGFSP